MRLKRVVLLAAQTVRSQAYVQALVASELFPEQVIILGAEEPSTPACKASLRSWREVMLPDPTESLSITCGRADIPVRRCVARDVNAEEVSNVIRETAADVVIYSGYGGQIVSSSVLALGSQFLHLHSGWLPEYRGSTTLYYALLNGELPGVTALILDRTIDTGPIVGRRHYPHPPSGLDLDLVYDAAIRADLLVHVIQNYVKSGRLTIVEHQRPDEGMVYYVIHPVLKHVAILSLDHGTS
jgi:methionyl-tRNA formyltransferase